MKKLSYLIVLVLILGLALTGCTLLSSVGQVPATEENGEAYLTKGSPFTIGNDATVRPITDTRSNFTIIDTNNPSSELGLLETFSYYAANILEFRFVLVDGSDVVQWVSAGITPSDPTPGPQTWIPLTPVYVEPGWNLGLYFASTGTVPFEYAGEPAWYGYGNTGVPVVGNKLIYQSSSNRIYSFVATGEVAELPSVPIITWPVNGACITSAALTHIDWDDSTGTFTPLEYQYQAYKYANYTTLIYSSSWLSASQIPTLGTPERVYYIRVRAQDSMGNLSDWSNGSTNPYKITVDNTPPVVTITTPAEGAKYILGETVLADWTATDALSGIASATGTVPSGSPIDTGTVGTKTFEVTATDNAGNSTTEKVTYSVYYVFNDFLPPVSLDKPFKLGRTIPIKFQLTDAQGSFITDAVPLISVELLSNGPLTGEVIDEESSGAANIDNIFRYEPDSNRYIFNLSTKGLTAPATYRITVDLGDGTMQQVNIGLK